MPHTWHTHHTYTTYTSHTHIHTTLPLTGKGHTVCSQAHQRQCPGQCQMVARLTFCSGRRWMVSCLSSTRSPLCPCQWDRSSSTLYLWPLPEMPAEKRQCHCLPLCVWSQFSRPPGEPAYRCTHNYICISKTVNRILKHFHLIWRKLRGKIKLCTIEFFRIAKLRVKPKENISTSLVNGLCETSSSHSYFFFFFLWMGLFDEDCDPMIV